MKYFLMLMSIFALLGASRSRAEDLLPPRFNFDRYSRMADHSPFAIATAVALPSATPEFAKDLYVANAAHSPEGDLGTIASRSDRSPARLSAPPIVVRCIWFSVGSCGIQVVAVWIFETGVKVNVIVLPGIFWRLLI